MISDGETLPYSTVVSLLGRNYNLKISSNAPMTQAQIRVMKIYGCPISDYIEGVCRANGSPEKLTRVCLEIFLSDVSSAKSSDAPKNNLNS